MFVPKRAAPGASNVAGRVGSTGAQAAAKKSASTAATAVLFDLETYLRNRDYVGALTLLGFKRQQRNENDTFASTGGESDGLENWRTSTWWLAYCHFQCGDFAAALDYFDQLLLSQIDQCAAHDPQPPSLGRGHDDGDAGDAEAGQWRLGRACCLYYMGRLEDAEQAALGTKRHALCNRLLYLIAHQRQHGERMLLDRYQQLSLVNPEDQLALASTSFSQRNFQESIEIYKRLIQQHKSRELGAVHVYLAMCYFKADYYDVALELVAVYLAAHPDSFFANNLKACSHYRLYSGYEAAQVLVEFKRKHPHHPCAQSTRAGDDAGSAASDSVGVQEVEAHNSVLFRASSAGNDGGDPGGVSELSGMTTATSAGAAAVATLRPLVGVIEEARLNLVLCHLQHREYQQAFELVEDLEPSTPSEYLVKGILHGVVGEQTRSKEHVFLAEKHFHAVGSSPDDADTIPGRQAMASYFILRKEYEDANVYLSSIAQYLGSSDSFNWNYGISLAAAGNFAEAEEVLLRVQNPALLSQLTFCSWLARCHIYNKRNAGNAWELYLRLDNTSDAYKLLKLVANDFYATKNYYFAAKAFDVLERLDPDPEYWEAKRGACVGYFQQIATGAAAFDAHRSDDVLKLLLNSKHTLEASQLATILRRWAYLDALQLLPVHRTKLQLVAPTLASCAELEAFHSREFVDALLQVKGALTTNSSASDLSTTHVPPAAPVVINLGGGRHHAMRSKASGFCYVNDIVLAIQQLQRKGGEHVNGDGGVLCVDIDVHHGDGVQEAFYFSESVTTVSFHLHERGFFPGSGVAGETEHGAGRGKYRNINVPLQRGISDTAYVALFQRVLRHAVAQLHPRVLVLVCGVDTLSRDSLGGFNLTSAGICACVDALLSFELPLLLLGGGGYSGADASKTFAQVIATALGVRDSLPERIPEHEYFPKYGPDFRVATSAVQHRPDENPCEALHAVGDVACETITRAAQAQRIRDSNKQQDEAGKR
ncbi:hypothetical protein PybrP1_000938 [[Pythium] brassicae (nom. inval.)]|nr:hypothetical protein PybrP1_000938 [[Pythium] brassicae (nom. inval.)]